MMKWTRYQLLLIFWFKYDLGQKYYARQIQPDRGLNSRTPDHDSSFHVAFQLFLS